MGRSTDFDIKAQECVKDRGSLAYRSLAAEYLDSYKECLAKFDSCFYYELENTFSCTCPTAYIGYIKPLGMKLGVCKDWPLGNLKDLNPGLDKLDDFRRYLIQRRDPEFIACIGIPRNLNSTMGNWKLKQLKITKKSRLIDTNEICTCGPDNCDPSAANKVTYKPDAPDDDTTITHTNELSESTAFPDGNDSDYSDI